MINICRISQKEIWSPTYRYHHIECPSIAVGVQQTLLAYKRLGCHCIKIGQDVRIALDAQHVDTNISQLGNDGRAGAHGIHRPDRRLLPHGTVHDRRRERGRRLLGIVRPSWRPPVVSLRLDVVLLLVADVTFDVAHSIILAALAAAAAIAASDGPSGRLDPRSSLLLLLMLFDPAKVFGTFQLAIPFDESSGVVMERLLALGRVAVDAGFVGSVVGKVGSAAAIVVAFVWTSEERNGAVWFGVIDALKKPFAGLERSKVEVRFSLAGSAWWTPRQLQLERAVDLLLLWPRSKYQSQAY